MPYNVYESLEWPESFLKFNKNVVTYATLTKQEIVPVTQKHIEANRLQRDSSFIAIQLYNLQYKCSFCGTCCRVVFTNRG